MYTAWDLNYELPHAIYLDGLDYNGLIRTGTRILADNTENPICDYFYWTYCIDDQAAVSCDEGYTPSHVNTSFATYNSDGQSLPTCNNETATPTPPPPPPSFNQAFHHQCCRNDDSLHAKNCFGYVDLLIAVNARRACGSMSESDPNKESCDSLVELTASRFLANPSVTWEDEITGRHINWPQ
jgi:hypothetical protein